MTHQLRQQERLLLDRLNSSDAGTRAAAVREIDTCSVKQLCQLAHRAASLQTSVTDHAAKVIVLPAFLALYFLVKLAAQSTPLAGVLVLSWALFLLAAVALLPFMPRRDMSRALQTLASEIDNRAQIRDVPMLLALLADEKETGYVAAVRLSIRSALRRLLPQLHPQDLEAMDAWDCASLSRLLRTPYADTPLTITVIETLARLPEACDLDAEVRLQEFARQSVATANMQQVRTAAQEALNQLQKRRLEAVQEQSLLRPAGADLARSPEELLRSSTQSPTTLPEEMLRPSKLSDAADVNIISARRIR